jgi:parvulin-like peptidyl-prolyl isomerase
MALRINGELITDEALREEERVIRPRLLEELAGETPLSVEAKVKQRAKENLIERAVLRQEALKDTEPIPQEVLDQVVAQIREQSPGESGCVFPSGDDQLRRELETRYRVEKLLGKVTAKVSPPKNKEISDHFVKNRKLYESPEMIHAGHIVKNVDENTDEAAAQAAIEEASKELSQGANFEELADRLSDCPGRGGDLGYFPRGQMVDAFEAVVFEMQPGQISPIFRTEFGFHIAKVYARKPAGLRDLSEVKEQIGSQMHEQKKQKTVEQFLDRLMSSAQVEEVEHAGSEK